MCIYPRLDQKLNTQKHAVPVLFGSRCKSALRLPRSHMLPLLAGVVIKAKTVPSTSGGCRKAPSPRGRGLG